MLKHWSDYIREPKIPQRIWILPWISYNSNPHDSETVRDDRDQRRNHQLLAGESIQVREFIT